MGYNLSLAVRTLIQKIETNNNSKMQRTFMPMVQPTWDATSPTTAVRTPIQKMETMKQSQPLRISVGGTVANNNFQNTDRKWTRYSTHVGSRGTGGEAPTLEEEEEFLLLSLFPPTFPLSLSSSSSSSSSSSMTFNASTNCWRQLEVLVEIIWFVR